MYSDLDLHVYCYDDKGRFLEKLNFDNPKTSDGGCTLVSDEGGISDTSSVTAEYVTIDFTKVGKKVSAYLLYLDGDSRNFQVTLTLTELSMIENQPSLCVELNQMSS